MVGVCARARSIDALYIILSSSDVGAADVSNIWLGFLLSLAVAIYHYLSRVILLFQFSISAQIAKAKKKKGGKIEGAWK